MPQKLKGGPRALLARFFVRPYEPVQVYGSVHNLARVGGVSILSIPKEYAPCDLVVPTRFAATAQFLADAGHGIPGLFRIPGQTRTIAALRDYFVGHLYVEDYSSTRESDIEVTVRIACLPSPSTLPYNIHDIASTFKHFLGELRGGILGSLDTFESLRKALMPPLKMKDADLDFQCCGLGEEEDPINSRWVTRVLCSVECAQRRNLILAVFGLLALLKQDPRDSFDYSPFMKALHDQCSPISAMNERMSSKAIGLVFAPLLLGNLTDQIRIDALPPSREGVTRRRSLIGSPRSNPKLGTSASMGHLKRASVTITKTPFNTPTNSVSTRETLAEKMKRKVSKREVAHPRELGDGVERNMIAARVVEVMVKGWEDVVLCLREAGYGRTEERWTIAKGEADELLRVRLRPKGQ